MSIQCESQLVRRYSEKSSISIMTRSFWNVSQTLRFSANAGLVIVTKQALHLRQWKAMQPGAEDPPQAETVQGALLTGLSNMALSRCSLYQQHFGDTSHKTSDMVQQKPIVEVFGCLQGFL